MIDAEVLKEIRKACKAPRPERFTDRDHCGECAAHDDLLRSRDLDSLRVEDFGNPGWDPICFVTEQSFFYYLPALAGLSLDQPSPGHGWYFDQLLFHLTYEGPSNRRMLAAGPRHKAAVLLLLGHVQGTRAGLIDEYGCGKELEQAVAIWTG